MFSEPVTLKRSFEAIEELAQQSNNSITTIYLFKNKIENSTSVQEQETIKQCIVIAEKNIQTNIEQINDWLEHIKDQIAKTGVVEQNVCTNHHLLSNNQSVSLSNNKTDQ